jgi:RNA polymerase sigma factor (sigma-70 family)
MSKPKHPATGSPDNNRRREAFEHHSQRVMSDLESSDLKRRTSEEFGNSLAAMNASLFALACFFLRGEPNFVRRRDLAEDARQIWCAKMLAGGFKSYLTKGKPFGLPFGPYATITLRNICVSLRRGRDRVGTLASLDGFSDPRCDPRDAAVRRELERDCRELIEGLPTQWQELLRSLYWDGRSSLEASDELRVNPQTVANWHLRSRRRLRDDFRRRGYWPP